MRPFQFIIDVPADWSESRVLNGEIGDFVTIARKNRRSENWYLGARIDRLFEGRGWRQGRGLISRNFPGAAHNEQAWRARVDVPLRFLLGRERPDA
jgi:hypothetical protein